MRAAPTFADAEAVVLWTAGVSMDIRVDTGGIKSLVRGGTGELLQMAFGGQGYVLVQPSESVVEGGAQQQGQKSNSGGLGGLLKLISDPGVQEGLRLLAFVGSRMSTSLREVHRRGL